MISLFITDLSLIIPFCHTGQFSSGKSALICFESVGINFIYLLFLMFPKLRGDFICEFIIPKLHWQYPTLRPDGKIGLQKAQSTPQIQSQAFYNPRRAPARSKVRWIGHIQSCDSANLCKEI